MTNQKGRNMMPKEKDFIEKTLEEMNEIERLKYENGGPYLDLLNVSPKQAKRDERHCNSGKLVGFVRNDEIWTLEPKTAFYDYIYISALIKNFGYDLNISEYQWFTDIEFNPQKSINCQARAGSDWIGRW